MNYKTIYHIIINLLKDNNISWSVIRTIYYNNDINSILLLVSGMDIKASCYYQTYIDGAMYHSDIILISLSKINNIVDDNYINITEKINKFNKFKTYI